MMLKVENDAWDVEFVVDRCSLDGIEEEKLSETDTTQGIWLPEVSSLE